MVGSELTSGAATQAWYTDSVVHESPGAAEGTGVLVGVCGALGEAPSVDELDDGAGEGIELAGTQPDAPSIRATPATATAIDLVRMFRMLAALTPSGNPPASTP